MNATIEAHLHAIVMTKINLADVPLLLTATLISTLPPSDDIGIARLIFFLVSGAKRSSNMKLDDDDDGAINPGSNLFVTGIHPRLSESEVAKMFEKYGDVEKCQIMRDPHTKESRGFGFVKMVTSDQAEAAKEGLQGEQIDGRTLSIEKARRARPRTPTPGKYFGPPKRGKFRVTNMINLVPCSPYVKRNHVHVSTIVAEAAMAAAMAVAETIPIATEVMSEAATVDTIEVKNVAMMIEAAATNEATVTTDVRMTEATVAEITIGLMIEDTSAEIVAAAVVEVVATTIMVDAIDMPAEKIASDTAPEGLEQVAATNVIATIVARSAIRLALVNPQLAVPPTESQLPGRTLGKHMEVRDTD